MSTAEALGIALEHQKAGRLQQAEIIYRQILQAEPRHADALHLLGVLAYQVGRNAEAIEQIRAANAVLPGIAVYHNNLGLAYRACHQLAEAKACHEQALRLDPGYAAAYANLGYVLRELSRLTEALDAYQQAVRLNPAAAVAHHCLGKVLQDLGRLPEALASHEEALRLQPAFADAHFHRGEILQDLGRRAEALASYKAAVACRPDFVEARYFAGWLLEDLGRPAEANEWWQPPFQAAPLILPSTLGGFGWGARMRAVLETPAIFHSADDMRRQRERLEEGLAVLEQQPLVIADPLTEVNLTNFYSAYHGLNDRVVQTRIAALYARATPSLNYIAPHCREPGQARPAGPLRVGFVSRFLHMATIGEVNFGIIRHLSREVCRVVVLQPPGPDDPLAKLICASADEVVALPVSLEAARQLIAELRLDVLFYTDIGMEPFTYFLAFARLAPVQCTTWGHPVTTGIPNMDYYLSSIDLEPPDADEHYSERLVRLRGLPTYYYAPAFFPPAKTRRHFGLEENEHIYLCSQAPFKIHPDYDSLLADILRADQKGHVYFIRSHNPFWTHQLLRRFQRTLPGEYDRIHFLPHQSGQDYLHLLAVCDVLLDSTHFGGGNTTFKAFSVGTPIVSLAGGFARSWVTSACYRKMAMPDCIAQDRADFVQKALRLGTDCDWRQEIHARICANRAVLFENPDVLRELEQFFTEAHQAKSALGH